MILRPFEYVECETVAEAVAALAARGDGARLIAGGTALVPLMKHQVLRPRTLVSMARVPGLAAIAAGDDGGLRIGALATHADVARSPLVRERAPLLAEACGRVASPTIRAMGTLGGNLCYGESASDPSPALLALRAPVRLTGPAGRRVLPLTDFFTGFYETALRGWRGADRGRGAAMPAGARWRYLKWTPRAQEDKALVGLAAVLVMEDGVCRARASVVGGVGASPVALGRAGRLLEGTALDGRAVARRRRRGRGRGRADRRSAGQRRVPARHAPRVDAPRAGRPRRLAGSRVMARVALALTVNGREVRVEVPGHWTLIQAAARRPRSPRHQGGLRRGLVRRVHRAGRRPPDARVPVARRPRRRRAGETVEGLAQRRPRSHPIQDAFVRHGAIQCGFCTPGLLMTTKALLAEHPRATDDADPRVPLRQLLPLRRLHAHHQRGARARGRPADGEGKGGTVKFGLILNTQFLAGEDPVAKMKDVVEQVRAARDNGFDSVCVSHHYLLTPFQMPQPLPLIGRLAAESGAMRLITNIFLLTMHTPAYVAEQVATLDVLTEGRLVFGVGLGYRPEEFEGMDVEMKTRVSRFVEILDVAKRLWTEEAVTHRGRHFSLTDAHLVLKPVQRPYPPVWIAASGDPAYERAGKLGHPCLINPHASLATVERQMALYRKALAEAGQPVPAETPIFRECSVAPSREAALADAPSRTSSGSTRPTPTGASTSRCRRRSASRRRTRSSRATASSSARPMNAARRSSATASAWE